MYFKSVFWIQRNLNIYFTDVVIPLSEYKNTDKVSKYIMTINIVRLRDGEIPPFNIDRLAKSTANVSGTCGKAICYYGLSLTN